uniref:Uncharacterized protein n=1 Tax=Aureoumbra lagunensis TaxID=44058 RepID=A0A7S3NFL9_9STRA|mmetsp:Transcript_9020/g.13881  ORF Transcript_9020/g.13881 Transcript_9020/m.13881 type:complete len:457 (+) Transcript_9020:112-1482(+)|eukprot:CAMPEP_0197316000 /NCGR_PEP_ID=MMETSP0891-20130614/40425_1 /TAXON_ID=44058 ORGANISM="Aureoumbra lagunensis, Strain CCMP1510" /NCGR_SAMPLE_ID=MMETSP0891 /ASSEMBLY_ACC=CAM_ASM_000534 /LENGTH=456 /DNA_ID=CAMNT_0042805245 /DNA_START=39 /DNA_END=1409 /DNA_ORIENTATION=-
MPSSVGLSRRWLRGRTLFLGMVTLCLTVELYSVWYAANNQKEIQFEKTLSPAIVIKTEDVASLFEEKKKIVAYAISVTKDGAYVDGAAVLAHSAIRVHRYGVSKYGVALIAFVSPAISKKTRTALEACGYRVLERDLPLRIADIQGEYLRNRIEKNGCCGAWELLKLYAWTLTEYHRVVHVDMDVLILQPLDELYDDLKIWGPQVRAVYTYDWTMARPPWGTNPPTQGGFIIAKPDIEVFNSLVDVVRKGDFQGGKGWGGTGVGAYWGGMTIQGLVPYFFEKLRPGSGFAVDECIYNNMATNPRSVGGFDKGECRDGTKPPRKCKDCRLVDVETIKTTHFTICQKPWECRGLSNNCPYCPLCTKLHAKWYDIRKEMEIEWGTFDYSGNAPERHGMCGRHSDGSRGYKPVPIDELVRNSSLARAWRASWQNNKEDPESTTSSHNFQRQRRRRRRTTI